MNEYSQKIIEKGTKKLKVRMEVYIRENKTIDKVFHDDILVHDIIEDFYVFKCCVNKVQLRVLYRVSGNEIQIFSVFVKKKDSKKYLNDFKKIVDNFKIVKGGKM